MSDIPQELDPISEPGSRLRFVEVEGNEDGVVRIDCCLCYCVHTCNVRHHHHISARRGEKGSTRLCVTGSSGQYLAASIAATMTVTAAVATVTRVRQTEGETCTNPRTRDSQESRSSR